MKEALVILGAVAALAYLTSQALLAVLHPLIVAFSSHPH